MSPYRLALRTLLLNRPRNVLATLLIAASLCVLDLFAGSIASTRAGIEYQAVIVERMGHLTVLPGAVSGAPRQLRRFSADEAGRVRSLLAGVKGIALVVPEMSVSGIATTGERSATFAATGVPDAPAGALLQAAPGKLQAGVDNGVAISQAKAAALTLRVGSAVTLTAAVPDAAPRQLVAQVVDVYQEGGGAGAGAGEGKAEARSMLMPLALAQDLLNTGSIERFVVFLSDPALMEQQRSALAAALRKAGVQAEVRTWQELSQAYMRARSASDLAFDSIAGMVFAVIAASIAATMSINVLERRREVATLRALGMRSHSVFLMLVTEALGMAVMGVAASLIGSGVIAWVINRMSLSDGAPQALAGAMPVELDVNRMMMAVVAVLAVALMAALVPAFKAARAHVAAGLAG
ncbi:FtsX-like permease family protein [Massilia violaceinigra]|uniref:FtsX-like permease family protein n=1 Tax=Massilia violaceinigra TaxID=2045208 RepID=A0ABY4ADE2_9BURK|nr:FtsX-like permease family protein [Massilia violaceinigra]UOD32175.1 FtsX-like permease family protein [Massilia violaceinigra]